MYLFLTSNEVLPVMPVVLAEIFERLQRGGIPKEISLRSLGITIIIIYIIIKYTYPLLEVEGIATPVATTLKVFRFFRSQC